MWDGPDTFNMTRDEDDESLQQTPSADSNMPLQRNSISQPALFPSARTASVNIASTLERGVPIIQTLEENNKLKSKVLSQSGEIRHLEFKLSETKSLLNRNVQEVVDEYLEMKLNSEEIAKFRQQSSLLKQEVLVANEDLDETKKALKMAMDKESTLLSRINELEEALTAQTAISDRTMEYSKLDDAKEKNPDLTVMTPSDEEYVRMERKYYDELMKVVELQKVVDQLSAELAEHTEKASAMTTTDGKTFVYCGSTTLTQEHQLRYIDELETNLKRCEVDIKNYQHALSTYMNKVSLLEKQLLNRTNNSLEASLTRGRSDDEYLAEIEKVTAELADLRTENRELRRKCNGIRGVNGEEDESLLPPSNDDKQAAGRGKRLGEGRQGGLIESETGDGVSDEQIAMRVKRASEKYEQLKEVINANRGAAGVDAANCDLVEINYSSSSESNESPEKVDEADQANKVALLQQAYGMDELSQLFQSLNTSINAEQVQQVHENIGYLKDVVCKLFERLKSSASLFEDILEKIGSESELAALIRDMKMNFDQSLLECRDVSQFIDTANRELSVLVTNISVFEKTMHDPSFIIGAASRMSMAQRREASFVQRESVANAEFQFKILDLETKIGDQLKVIDSGRDQIEQLIVEKSTLEAAQQKLRTNYDLLKDQLAVVQANYDTELQRRLIDDEKLEKNFLRIQHLEEEEKQLRKLHTERVEQLNQEVEALSDGLYNVKVREEDLVEKMRQMNEQLTEAKEACSRAETDARRNLELAQELLTSQANAEEELERLREWERHQQERIREQITSGGRATSSSDAPKPAERNSSCQTNARESEKLQEAEKEVAKLSKKLNESGRATSAMLDGLELIQSEVVKLTAKNARARLHSSNVEPVREVCDEICSILAHEGQRQHKMAKELRRSNNVFQDAHARGQEQENVAPTCNDPANFGRDEAKEKRRDDDDVQLQSRHKPFHNPVRELLYEAVQKADQAVQQVKKCESAKTTADLQGNLKRLLEQCRQLRTLLHDKFLVLKLEDTDVLARETNEQLIERVLLLEEQLAATSKVRNVVDLVPRIQAEMGAIAKTMKDAKAASRGGK